MGTFHFLHQFGIDTPNSHRPSSASIRVPSLSHRFITFKLGFCLNHMCSVR